MTTLEEAILAELDYPERWTCKDYTIHHVGGLELWTANGRAYLKVYAPMEAPIRWSERFGIWRKIQEIRRAQALAILTSRVTVVHVEEQS